MSNILGNPITIIIILLGIGVAVVAATKFFEEYGLNKQLRLKQRSMRIKGEVMTSRKSLLGAAALAPTLLILVGIFVFANMGNNDVSQYIKINSSQDIKDIYSHFQSQTNQDSYYLRDGWGMEAEFDALEADAPANDEGTGSDDYSGPNNQVANVDELDNVVTDGKYIFTMHGASIQVTLAFKKENEIEDFGLVTEITYPQDPDVCEQKLVYPIGMYASNEDDYLVVVANEYDNYNYECEEYKAYDYWYWGQSNSVKVYVYDKTNDFALVDEYSLNGYYTGTRKIDNHLYVITNEYIPLYDEEVNVDDYLPYNEVNGVMEVAQYSEIVYVDGTNPNTFTTFYGIDLNTKEVDMEVVLGDNGYNLYVSENNMYLVGSVYYFFPEDSLFSEPTYDHRTVIMKVGIDKGEVEFDSIGYVEGYTLNQFSMDEYNGYLRITTTTGWWGQEINNRLWVLDEDLEIVSVLEHLGEPGETIRSTRFAGDYGYVVTFEQTDPFYVIDLSDPLNPEKVGELHKPDFATYLQPLNNDYMLGIGFDTDSEGRVQGMVLEIYDTSDKTDPVLFDSVTFPYSEFGWTWSSVTYNHKDLLVDLRKGMIAFPFSASMYTEEDGYQYNSGIMMFDLDLENGFGDRHFIVHEEDGVEYVNVYKALYIDDYLYTVSNKFVAVSFIAEPELILDRVNVLRQDNYYYYWGWGIEEPMMD